MGQGVGSDATQPQSAEHLCEYVSEPDLSSSAVQVPQEIASSSTVGRDLSYGRPPANALASDLWLSASDSNDEPVSPADLPDEVLNLRAGRSSVLHADDGHGAPRCRCIARSFEYIAAPRAGSRFCRHPACFFQYLADELQTSAALGRGGMLL